MFRKFKHVMFVAFAIFTTCFITTNTSAQVVINEVDYHNGRVEIKNLGDSTVDISSWQFCSLFIYTPISGLTVEFGSTTPASGDLVVFSGLAFNNTAADLGLYSSSDFGNAEAMQSFVQWGSGGNARESVAVGKGIWTAGDFVPTVASGNSMAYDGDGTASSDWLDLAAPTFGSDNSPSIAVRPRGKLTTTWGKIKRSR
jgi:hypothetical protein